MLYQVENDKFKIKYTQFKSGNETDTSLASLLGGTLGLKIIVSIRAYISRQTLWFIYDNWVGCFRCQIAN